MDVNQQAHLICHFLVLGQVICSSAQLLIALTVFHSRFCANGCNQQAHLICHFLVLGQVICSSAQLLIALTVFHSR